MRIKEPKKRDAEFEAWENSIAGVLNDLKIWGATDDEEGKIIIAKTLLRLPCKIRRRILDSEVVFILIDAEGMADTLTFSKVVSKEDVETIGDNYCITIRQPVIFLRFRPKEKESSKMDLIAHEIAHHIAGRSLIRHRLKGGYNIGEKKADDLVMSWGFKRCYKSYKL